MFYKSASIHKNRIFPYFQNKVKNVINIIIIMLIIKTRELIIQKNEQKDKI